MRCPGLLGHALPQSCVEVSPVWPGRQTVLAVTCVCGRGSNSVFSLCSCCSKAMFSKSLDIAEAHPQFSKEDRYTPCPSVHPPSPRHTAPAWPGRHRQGLEAGLGCRHSLALALWEWNVQPAKEGARPAVLRPGGVGTLGQGRWPARGDTRARSAQARVGAPLCSHPRSPRGCRQASLLLALGLGPVGLAGPGCCGPAAHQGWDQPPVPGGGG